MQDSEAELRSELAFFSRFIDHASQDLFFLALGMALGAVCMVWVCSVMHHIEAYAERKWVLAMKHWDRVMR